MITLKSDEQIIKQESVMYLKSSLNVMAGILYLTNHRLVFERSRNMMFGLIGLLAKANRGGVVLELPRGDIAGAVQGQHALNHKMLVVTTTSGTEYKFNAKYQDWLPLLSK